ncbi:hypothetical protein GOBAR_AA38114 [Gossypium barbadense]|uniref:Piwi domain-containing protein n=1 Tax=Gossypium barbadense TaxID=3634 RepID=A0A2P5VUT2_GOSBA|nr:hypothetical protein GOBAR_AA38114 [Gossypium barbadense]
MLTLGQTPLIPVVSKVPTIILGMGALFGFPEQSDVPSIAAMVSSRRWPLISNYEASGWMGLVRVSNSIKFDQVIEACKFLDDEVKNPKDVWLLLYEKPINTKFSAGIFLTICYIGTVIDNKVCHPKNNDFYLGTHTGMIGITRQTHYHVLLDQAGFSADDLQEFLHSWGQFMKIRDASETSSSHGGMYAPEVISVPQLSRLKDKVSNFILVC